MTPPFYRFIMAQAFKAEQKRFYSSLVQSNFYSIFSSIKVYIKIIIGGICHQKKGGFQLPPFLLGHSIEVICLAPFLLRLVLAERVAFALVKKGQLSTAPLLLGYVLVEKEGFVLEREGGIYLGSVKKGTFFLP